MIAQPVVQLSTIPTLVEEGLRPRHADLRPFAVNDGTDVWVLPGGLTRVALPEGELVVNSSQGGGSKDTWVLGEARDFEAVAGRGIPELVAEQAATTQSIPIIRAPADHVPVDQAPADQARTNTSQPHMQQQGSLTQADVLATLALDRTHPGSITYSLGAARENARRAREIVSTEL